MMFAGISLAIIIPVWNEVDAIQGVLKELDPKFLPSTLVVDGGSTDGTPAAAASLGVRVVSQRGRGYGAACWTGVEESAGADVLVFLDGDYSDPPVVLPDLIGPIVSDSADLVLARRTVPAGHRHPLPLHARLGNVLVCRLIGWRTGVTVADLPSMKAVGRARLLELTMSEMTYGWTTELIAKAAARRWRIQEINIGYRDRLGGESKVSGHLGASFRAARSLLGSAWRHTRSVNLTRS